MSTQLLTKTTELHPSLVRERVATNHVNWDKYEENGYRQFSNENHPRNKETNS